MKLNRRAIKERTLEYAVIDKYFVNQVVLIPTPSNTKVYMSDVVMDAAMKTVNGEACFEFLKINSERKDSR